MTEANDSQMVQKSILGLNQLSYSLQPDLSVCTSRTSTTQFFISRQAAPGENMIATLNTGAAFIWGPGCFINLTIKNESSEKVDFGRGTACNIFQRLSILTRSGVVVENIDNVNLLAYQELYYKRCKDYQEGVGQAAGFGAEGLLDAGKSKAFCIPLSMISGLFSYENLLPSALMSGLRIELTLATGLKALRLDSSAASAVDLKYQVIDSSIQLDSYMLTDSVSRTLNESAASSGLEVVIRTHFCTVGTREDTKLVQECRRAVSRALSAFVKCTTPRVSSEVDSLKKCPMQSTPIEEIAIPLGPVSYQFQFGSSYQPNAPARGIDALKLAPQLFSHAQAACKRYSKGMVDVANSVTLTNFKAANWVFATDLERTSTQSLSGIPLSNSRSLSIVADFEDGGVRLPQNTSFFLEYVTVIRVYSSNASIEV